MNNIPKTNKNSLRLLAKSIINKLENRKFIEFNPLKRNDLSEALVGMLEKTVFTDEHITDKVRNDIARMSDNIADQNITETAAFQTRKKQLKDELGENEMHGFYFKGTVRDTVLRASKFFMDTPIIEEVYESDENIHKLLLETIQTFDESKIA